ncbi:MAG TPA: cytochrome c oxidase assembly protein [Candidatus Binatia bacterium]
MKKFLLLIAALLLVSAPLYFVTRTRHDGDADPVQVLSRYLKATYARDFREAYRFLSSRDKQAKSEKVYVSEQGAFRGFALQAARQLAQSIRIRPVELKPEGERLNVRVALNLPDANSVAPLLMDWDEDRLDHLSRAERQKILGRINNLQRTGALKTLSGEEQYALVKEPASWKIALDLDKGVRVSFGATVPPDMRLQAAPENPQTIAKSSDPFNVIFRIKNNSDKMVSTRVTHRIQPKELADYIDIVQCALLLPVTLQPGEEAEYSSTYLLRPDAPKNIPEIKITYEFKVES